MRGVLPVYQQLSATATRGTRRANSCADSWVRNCRCRVAQGHNCTDRGGSEVLEHRLRCRRRCSAQLPYAFWRANEPLSAIYSLLTTWVRRKPIFERVGEGTEIKSRYNCGKAASRVWANCPGPFGAPGARVRCDRHRDTARVPVSSSVGLRTSWILVRSRVLEVSLPAKSRQGGE